MNRPDSMAEALDQAKRLHQAGKAQAAEPVYRQWLTRHPHDAEVMQLLGLALAQTNRITEAIPLWREAASRLPQRPDLWNNLGEACRRAGQVDEALAHLQRAVKLAPNFAEGHFNLANVLKELDRHDESVAEYRRAISLQPNHAKAWFNLGNTLREQGKTPPARDAYLNAVQLRSNWVEALQNLGVAEMELDDVQGAISRYEAAYRLAPQNADLEELQALAYQKLGRTDQARQWYAAAAQRSPDDWLRQLRLESLIEPISSDEAAIEACYQRVDRALDRFESASRPIDVAKLHNSGVEPPMTLVYQRLNVRPLWDRFGDLFARHLQYEPPPARTGKAHVGIVVTHGHEGVFAACFGGIAQRLPSSDLQVSVVCPLSSANVLDHLCGPGSFNFVRTPAKLDEAAGALRAAGIDLLWYWEVGTDSTNYFLPFFRPARVQIAGWGWPISSGGPCIDMYLSCADFEPPEAQDNYREKLVTLPALPTWYARPKLPSSLEPREAFGLDPAAHLYMCHQNLRKWHPHFDALLERICATDPAAQLVFIGDKQRVITDALLGRLARTAPTAAARIKSIGFLEKPRYLNLLSLADVALDTRFYGGGANTVYDAIAVGTPIVTWPAPVHRGRWTAAALSRVGCEELIAASADDYCARAVCVASQPEYRAELSARLRSAGEQLFEDRRTVDEHRAFFMETISANRG